MVFELQPLIIPVGCRIAKNDFTTYDPETEYSEDRSLFYLTEDLLQIEFSSSNLVIDLGWYGDFETNDGQFKICVIQNEDWSNPLIIEESKSQSTIHERLERILLEIRESGNIKPVPNNI